MLYFTRPKTADQRLADDVSWACSMKALPTDLCEELRTDPRQAGLQGKVEEHVDQLWKGAAGDPMADDFDRYVGPKADMIKIAAATDVADSLKVVKDTPPDAPEPRSRFEELVARFVALFH